MKRFFVLSLSLIVSLLLVGCTAKTTNKKENKTNASTQVKTTVTSKEKTLSHDEFVALADDSAVVVTAYVQACQTWWNNKITVYLADRDGAYFAYNMVCSEADAAKLVPGTKIKITGYKTSWAGELEIAEGATFEIVQGGDTYIAPAYDVTSIVGNETELIKHQNELVSFKNATVSKAYLYKWDGSGSEGDDLYFNVTIGGAEYTFTVESYLCDKNSEVYQDVKALQVGDVIDLEGFCYWYNGLNPHITKVITDHDKFVALEDDQAVVVTAYVQATQVWWNNKITVYLADRNGAYFAYNMACTEENAALLVPGTKIKITGYKTSWAGELEIAEGATFEFVQGGDTYIAPAYDVTSFVGNETELIKHQNELVSFKGATVSKAYLYKWDGSGSEGDDLYFNVTIGGAEYTFTVESYLCDKDSDVYKAVKELKVGDVIDLEGFCYWYNGLNPHITKVTLK